jgi:predicted Zn-dependent protease
MDYKFYVLMMVVIMLKRNKINYFIIVAFLLISSLSSAFEPYSNDELDELQKQFIEQINQSDKVLRNPVISEFINHLGNKLSNAARMKPANFFVVNSSDINAFAGPGGYIGINTQLILATRNESELAAVMSHELSHVKLHHLYRMIEHQKRMRIPMMAAMLAAIALGSFDPTLASSAALGTLSGFTQDAINFTRSNEKEADSIGINVLMQANFNPKAMVTFFQKMQENSRYYYSANTPAILRTHPLDDDRIAEALNRIPRKLPDIHEENDYFAFKELIRNEVTIDKKSLLDFYQARCKMQDSSIHDYCQYGQALAFINIGKLEQAKNNIDQLLKVNPNNLFFNIAKIELSIKLHDYATVKQDLNKLIHARPDSYAVLYSASQFYINMKQYEQAELILLKSRRHFPQDLLLCKSLAQAQARSNKIATAYFTEANCSLLQGYKHDAMSKLRHAKAHIKHSSEKYLTSRIDALIDQIK